MWSLSWLVCVGWRPSRRCVCVWRRWGDGIRAQPLLTLAVFRCSAWPTALHKPAESGTNAAVKHQTWQLRQTLLITACAFSHICLCAFLLCACGCSYYCMQVCAVGFVWFLTGYDVFCQIKGSCTYRKINSGSINGISGWQTLKTLQASNIYKSLQWNF